MAVRRARIKAVASLPVRRRTGNGIPQQSEELPDNRTDDSKTENVNTLKPSCVTESLLMNTDQQTVENVTTEFELKRTKNVSEAPSTVTLGQIDSMVHHTTRVSPSCEIDPNSQNKISDIATDHTEPLPELTSVKQNTRRKILKPTINILNANNRFKPDQNKLRLKLSPKFITSSPKNAVGSPKSYISSPKIISGSPTKSGIPSTKNASSKKSVIDSAECPNSVASPNTHIKSTNTVSGPDPFAQGTTIIDKFPNTISNSETLKTFIKSPKLRIGNKTFIGSPSTKIEMDSTKFISKMSDAEHSNLEDNVEDVESAIDGITPLPPPHDTENVNSMMLPNDCFFDPIIPLPSPTKVRPKLKPAPHLSNRRNSFHGSASESEEEMRKHQLHQGISSPTPHSGRQRHDSLSSLAHRSTPLLLHRDATRIRTESFSSLASERLPGNANPVSVGSLHLREKLTSKSRTPAIAPLIGSTNVGTTPAYGGIVAMKKEVNRKKSRIWPGQPRSSYTMYDLIFCNPATNALQDCKPDAKDGFNNTKEEEDSKPSISQPKNILQDIMKLDDIRKHSKFKVDDDNDADDESDAMPVPQLKLGPNGEIVLDEQSLVVDSTALKMRAAAAATGADAILEDDLPLGSRGTYSRSARTRDWTPSETLRFYRAVAALGVDFALMVSLFPGRTRHNLKMKYKKEERMNKQLLELALSQPFQGDFEGNLEDIRSSLKREQQEEIESSKRTNEDVKLRRKKKRTDKLINALRKQLISKKKSSNNESDDTESETNISEKNLARFKNKAEKKRIHSDDAVNTVKNLECNNISESENKPLPKIAKTNKAEPTAGDTEGNRLGNESLEVVTMEDEDMINSELQNSVERTISKLFAEPNIVENNISDLVEDAEILENYKIVPNVEVTDLTENFNESDIIEESAVRDLIQDTYNLTNLDDTYGQTDEVLDTRNEDAIAKKFLIHEEVNIEDSDIDFMLENNEIVESTYDVATSQDEINVDDSDMDFENIATKVIDVDEDVATVDLINDWTGKDAAETDEELVLSSVTVPIAPIPDNLEVGSLVLMMTTTESGEKIPRAYLSTTAGPNPNLKPIDLPPNIVQTLIASIGITKIKLNQPSHTRGGSETALSNSEVAAEPIRNENYCITLL